MTGTVCSVVTCKSNKLKAAKTGEDIRFFSFPKKPQIRKEWVRRCYRKDKFNPLNKRICSKHFEFDQYVDEIEAQIKNRLPKRLKGTAIPTINLLPTAAEKRPRERSSRLKVKEQKEIIEDILASVKPDEPSTTTVNINLDHQYCQRPDDIPSTSRGDCDVAQHCASSLTSPYEILYKKFSALQKENETLINQATENEKILNIVRVKYENLQRSILRRDGDFTKKVKELFKEFLSPKQVDIILKKKTKARWTSGEISKAFTLRHLSKRAYIYVRQILKYPLPGVSTLQSWAASTNLENRLLKARRAQINKKVNECILILE